MHAKRFLFWSILFVVLFVCFSCTRIRYTVVSHLNPEYAGKIQIGKFYLASVADNPTDKIIELKLLNLVRTSLVKKNWQETESDEEADVIFGIVFDMESDKENYSGSKGITTWYDTKGRQHISGGKSYSGTRTVYKRSVSVVAMKNQEVVWVSNCISEGSTPDVYFAAERMLPKALSKFPEEGLWRK